MIPASNAGKDLSTNPIVVTIQKCLDDLNQISSQKDIIMAEGVAMHENLNAVEELLKVFQTNGDQNAAFEVFRQRYLNHFI